MDLLALMSVKLFLAQILESELNTLEFKKTISFSNWLWLLTDSAEIWRLFTQRKLQSYNYCFVPTYIVLPCIVLSVKQGNTMWVEHIFCEYLHCLQDFILMISLLNDNKTYTGKTLIWTRIYHSFIWANGHIMQSGLKNLLSASY